MAVLGSFIADKIRGSMVRCRSTAPFRAISSFEWRTIQNKGQWNLMISLLLQKWNRRLQKLALREALS